MIYVKFTKCQFKQLVNFPWPQACAVVPDSHVQCMCNVYVQYLTPMCSNSILGMKSSTASLTEETKPLLDENVDLVIALCGYPLLKFPEENFFPSPPFS